MSVIFENIYYELKPFMLTALGAFAVYQGIHLDPILKYAVAVSFLMALYISLKRISYRNF